MSENENIAPTDFTINAAAYDWSARSYRTVRKGLGLNPQLHGPDNLLEQGQIFLFNHFARFETFVPPYIIFDATGAYSRIIADKGLFEIGEGFSKFLRGVGAVPNDLPGLLPFLAAEILRGRKVVIFPEGGMIKDRRVVSTKGDYGVYSRKSEERRKHHRGAAVLALTLDIFKRRIRDLYERGDDVRIARWVEALNMDSTGDLLAAAGKPTQVVPGNITFYPIRIDDNLLSQGAEWFSKGLSPKLVEELVIEGNLLLRDTDMDIRLGPPAIPRKRWRWWERMLLERYFKTISSLDDLFNLREGQTETWSEKMLARCISKETYRIRDAYMAAMYKLTTVNLSHVASTAITQMIGRGLMQIGSQHLHKTLYLALKNLQAAEDVHLHTSLTEPDRYRGLLDGHCPPLDRFLETCNDAGLVGRARTSYRFLTPLCEEYAFDQVRLENPVLVYANEAAPIRAVGATVETALAEAETISDAELASFLFDDEQRAHAWNRERFSGDKYTEINAAETATISADPFLLLPKGHVKTGVLLVHGFLASPAEVRGYGDELCRRGYAVLGVRLAGHGTSPWDLKSRSWQDWMDSIRRNDRILSAFVEQVVVVGFSAGGALGLLLAAEAPAHLAGVVSISAPVGFRDRKMAFVPLVHGLNKLSSWLPSFDGIMPFRDNEAEHPDINYRAIPVTALYELRVMIDKMQDRLPAIHIPALIVQGDQDPVVEPDSASQILGKLTVADKALHWVQSGRHGILYEDVGETRARVTDFIDRIDNTPAEVPLKDQPQAETGS